jgi:hypothetical protein
VVQKLDQVKVKVKLFCLVLFTLIWVPVITTAQGVIYNFARDANFSQYRTFKLINIEGATSGCRSREIMIVSHIAQFCFGLVNRMCAQAINGVCAFSDLLANELD